MSFRIPLIFLFRLSELSKSVSLISFSHQYLNNILLVAHFLKLIQKEFIVVYSVDKFLRSRPFSDLLLSRILTVVLSIV